MKYKVGDEAKTDYKKYIAWLLGDDDGLSSKSILAMCLDIDYRYYLPADFGDFGRCYRLFKMFPELKKKFMTIEMPDNNWELLRENWSDLTGLYEANDYTNFTKLIDLLS